MNSEYLNHYAGELRTELNTYHPLTAGLTEDQVRRGVIAFVQAATNYLNLSNALPSIGRVLSTEKVYGYADTKAMLRRAFAFATYIVERGDAKQVLTSSESITDGGKLFVQYTNMYELTKDSELHKVVDVEEDGADFVSGLFAEPFADYNSEGWTEDGDSIFLDRYYGNKEGASQLTIDAVNCVQKQAYERTEATDKALAAYTALKDNLEEIMKKAKHAARQDKSATGKPVIIAPTAYNVDSVISGCTFLKEHDKGYIKYGIDRRGRQYPMANFSHFSNAVAPLVVPIMHELEEAIGAEGKNKSRTVKRYGAAIDKLLAGDLSGMSLFFKPLGKKQPDGTRLHTVVTKDGETIIARGFDIDAFSAAIALSCF